MIKKIISSIILIMIICSSCIYATNVIVPEDTTPPSDEGQETIAPDDSITNGDSENKTPETGDNNDDSNINDNTNTDSSNNENLTDNNTGSNDATNNDNESQTNNSQTGSNSKPPKDIIQEPIKNNNNVVQKSSEARLKELKVDVEGLSPKFDKNTTEYYLVIDLNVNKINIKASTVDNKAKWAVYGNKNLKEGENTITINVTAEDGTKKEYYIHVTKVDNIEMANAELEKLDIQGFSLYPSFKSNIYSYNLNINQDISNLNITAVPLNDKATVEIEGNENLQEGENIIKINVTAANEETVRTYKINTYISLDKVELKEEDKTPAIVLIAVLSMCIIGLGISIVVKNRK